jgi:hypothetical protein
MSGKKTIIPIQTSNGIKLVDKNTRALAGSVSTLGKTVPTINSLPVIKKTPLLDADHVEYFTEEYCDKLAVELHRQTGWPFFVCVEDWINGGDHEARCNSDAIIHVLIGLPDGTFLDANGIQTEAEVLQEWSGTTLEHAAMCCFGRWFHYGGPDRKKVKHATGVLLKAAKEQGHFVGPYKP